MLRTALGPAIARFLEDPAIVEVMLNRTPPVEAALRGLNEFLR